MNEAAEEVATARPASITGRIETDAFCERCGFNLHRQPVVRDARLNILVTRCPECGAHQAAGRMTTSGRAWLSRVATVALTLWMCAVAAGILGGFLCSMGLTGGASETLVSKRYYVAGTGDEVTDDYASNGHVWRRASDSQEVPLNGDQVVARFQWIPAIGGPARPENVFTGYDVPPQGLLVMSMIFGMLIFGCGTIAAAMTWFWRPGWRWAWLLLPLLAGVAAIALNAVSAPARRYSNYGLEIARTEGESLAYVAMIAVTLAQTVVLAAGLLVGRPLVRLFVSIVVPPRSRQLFAFLWHADGKTLRGPSAASPS